MFKSPEHALMVAFAVLERRVEPKNATLQVIEALEDKGGPSREGRRNTGLTPHEWHAQAAMTLAIAENSLRDSPILWQAVVAEYSQGPRGALAIREVSNAIAPDLTSQDRLLADLLVMRAFRRRPPIRTLEEAFGVPRSTLHRRQKDISAAVAQMRDQAMVRMVLPLSDMVTVDPA